ncbi:NADH-quinone oxidoreductase subunit M [Rhodococcoides fascians]|uniref:NADH-quinone oxidoreductase subunit M n=1 Tax=Rhodococcoides fascians TaxID=1828 RepID=UPI000B9C1A6C|nr:NADH-quinone oxidoreductase subunit M [Rhodococcus fascians]MBY4205322.1 NADH-quinone oxidoreductase subunit M [Rhodococcus fascians]OZE84268.1 NADH-quinone oxidoreductase subunit M [Rhodococcus fascians]OZF11155.1 NADH-quinone oxidoreductase subunit M [Rhodococcus fascians]OZF14914.1 NADH-quinone oxidoreductase subunit M [Rhodococcus fascians]OZF61494.1 NADH-quinone oxidoreductase subunit M [Rhodococcus fascians]
MTFPWLTVLWVLPILGAIVVALVPADRPTIARGVAVGFATGTLVVSVVLAVAFDSGGDRYQFLEDHSWIAAFGARYTLGLDGIGLVLVLLTTVLTPLLLVAGWHDGSRVANYGSRRVSHTYMALILVVESMVIVSFLALDVLLFYIFFEAMLIPMYFLIGGFGGTERTRAAVKFLLYNLFGGLVMLAAVIGLYVVTARPDGPFDGGTFDLRAIADAASSGGLGVDPMVLNALFLGFMFAFAIKAPLWPFHTWLPDAAVQSTPATAVLMMSVVDKVGTFAMLRFCLELFPGSSQTFAPWIITLAVIGIVYGAILAIGQTDMMRLIAYTSISHFGFIILGIFAMTGQSQAGATLYMVNHGISTAALFLIAGFLVSRRGSRAIADYGGVQKVAPVLAGTFLISGLATLSLPGLAPFISEFLVLIGTFGRYGVAAIVATGALVLSAIYILWLYQRVMTGPVREGSDKISDLVPREALVVVPLLALLIVFGVYPKPALDIITPAVQSTIVDSAGGQR